MISELKLIFGNLGLGSSRWTAKERLKFREAYRTKGKNFHLIQKEVGALILFLCYEKLLQYNFT